MQRIEFEQPLIPNHDPTDEEAEELERTRSLAALKRQRDRERRQQAADLSVEAFDPKAAAIKEVTEQIASLKKNIKKEGVSEAIRDCWRGDPILMAKIQNRCQALRRMLQQRRRPPWR